MKGTLIASLIIIVWAALFTQSVWKLAQNFRAFDPTPGCHNSNACVDRIPGRVVESGATDVTVSYDAGRKRTLIEPDDSDFAAPPDGSTVLVERWRGATIAIVDPSGTRRIKDSDWPDPYPDDVFAFAFYFALGFGGSWLAISGTIKNRDRAKLAANLAAERAAAARLGREGRPQG